MKRFESRLDSLRRLKDQQEQLAGAHAAVFQQRYALARTAVSERQKQLDATNERFGQLQTKDMGAEVLHGIIQLYERQQNELDVARQACVIAQLEAEKALDAWTDSRKDLKVIEQRIDTERQEFRRLALIHEEHRQQETTASTFFRRSKSDNGVSER